MSDVLEELEDQRDGAAVKVHAVVEIRLQDAYPRWPRPTWVPDTSRHKPPPRDAASPSAPSTTGMLAGRLDASDRHHLRAL